MYLLSDLSTTSLHTSDFCHLVNALTPTDCGDWQNWRPYKIEVLAVSSKAFIHTTTKGYLRVVYPTTQ